MGKLFPFVAELLNMFTPPRHREPTPFIINVLFTACGIHETTQSDLR